MAARKRLSGLAPDALLKRPIHGCGRGTRMVRHSDLPLLPLMTAGLAPALVRWLRLVGLPVTELSRMPLSAEGPGRFVLFDSRVGTSIARMKAGRRLGLYPLDLAEIEAAIPGGLAKLTDHESGIVRALDERELLRRFIDELKLRLESAGGVWARLADYPHPYRAALSVAVDQPDLLRWLPAPLPITCFVDTRLRDEDLKGLLLVPSVEIAWRVTAADVEATPRKTTTHWQTRRERFARAGWPVAGLKLVEPVAGLPRSGDLGRMGFAYTARTGPWDLATIRSAADAGPEPLALSVERVTGENGQIGCDRSSWIALGADASRWQRLDTAHVLHPAPVASGPVGPVRHLADRLRSPEYQEQIRRRLRAGEPVLLDLPGSDVDEDALVALRAAGQAAPLVWSCALATFARWQKLRMQTRISVWRRDFGYEVHAESPLSGDATVGVELWRGHHMANLPLTREILDIPDQGLLFQTPETSPAGWRSAPTHLSRRPFDDADRRIAHLGGFASV